ncbi:MAG: hypothetical protein AAGG51_17700 [Cyanobacteria bacterium P01_G01_bin.54]
MSNSHLSHQLREYEQRLQNLGTLRGKPVRDRTLAVLGLLNHRENLHRTLNAVNTLPNHSLQHLLKLDARLKQNAGYIIRKLLNPNQLETWRKEILNRSDQWWWHLEDKIADRKKMDFCKFLRVLSGW